MGTNALRAPLAAPDFERTAGLMRADLRAAGWEPQPRDRWRSPDRKRHVHLLPLATAWEVARQDAEAADDAPPFGPFAGALVGGPPRGPAVVREDYDQREGDDGDECGERSTDDLLDPAGSLAVDDFAQAPAPDDGDASAPGGD